MGEFYQNNHTFGSTEGNYLGDELNSGVLNDTASKAGSRNLKYSSKKSDSPHTEEKTNNDLVKEISNATSTGTGGVGTAIGTSAAVGGVVIATVIIFTSLLGNQFKVVDNSTSLSLYRNEDNVINLDYSFDLQYDRSGSVFVKLLSASHNLTSEEYVLTYEDIDSTVTYESYDEPVEEGEEPTESKTVEKAKEIYTISISGSFTSLIEANEYTFAITSLIDGVESRIYSQRLYIPSSYVNVIDGSVEAYKEEDTIFAYYNFAVEYESNSEAYVELKHLVDNEKYVVEQTSEVYHFSIEEKNNGEEKFYSEIGGEFTNLMNDNEYIISVISTANGRSNTSYSQKVIPHFEPEPPVDHVYQIAGEPGFTTVAENGSTYLKYNIAVVSEFEGKVIVNIKDKVTEQQTSEAIYAIDTSKLTASIEDQKEVTLGNEYVVTVTSEIAGYREDIYTQEVLADGLFGSVEDADFMVVSTTSGNETSHLLSYSFAYVSQANATNLTLEVLNSNNVSLFEDILGEVVPYSSDSLVYKNSAELNDIGPYTVNIYATYGTRQLIYTEQVVEQHVYELLEEPVIDISASEGELKLNYAGVVRSDYEGSVIVTITDLSDQNKVIAENTHTISASAATMQGSFENSVTVALGHEYKVTFTSSISGYNSVIYEKPIAASGAFGEVVEQGTTFSAVSYNNDEGVLQHKFTYDIAFSTTLSGTNLILKISVSNGTLLKQITLAEQFVYTQTADINILNYNDTINLETAGPYTIEVLATYDKEYTLYTTTVEEVAASFFDVNENNLNTETYYSAEDKSVITMITLDTTDFTEEGYVYYELVNITDSKVQTSEHVEITNATTGRLITKMPISDVTTNYTLRVRSVISEDILVFTTTIDTKLVYGELTANPAVRSYYSEINNCMEYELTYTFATEVAGSVYFVVTDGDQYNYTFDNPRNIAYTAGEEKTVNYEFFDLVANVTYTITLYGDWGQGDVEIYSSQFTVEDYGITADSSSVSHDYADMTLTVPVTVYDPHEYLSEIVGTLVFTDEDNQEIEFTAEYDETNHQLVFQLNENVTKGTYAQLTITAVDSNNNNVNATFVNIAIWY